MKMLNSNQLIGTKELYASFCENVIDRYLFLQVHI